jgi:hypothetical protein
VKADVIELGKMHRPDWREPHTSGEVALHHKNETYFTFAIAATLALTARM